MNTIAKLFVTTFLIIFIAELGDKTQLAVMARSASASARWTVFLAASAALVTSTLVAVLLGGQLTRWVPEHIIRLGAGVVFVLFGLLLIREALRSSGGAAEPMASSMHRGPLTKLTMAWAAEFEKSAFDGYHALAGRARDPSLKRLLARLAQEEDSHFARITDLRRRHSHAHLPPGETAEDLLAHVDLVQTVIPEGGDRAIAAYAAAQERVTAGFYRELARLTLLPSLRRAFLALAEVEEVHAADIDAWLAADREHDRTA